MYMCRCAWLVISMKILSSRLFTATLNTQLFSGRPTGNAPVFEFFFIRINHRILRVYTSLTAEFKMFCLAVSLLHTLVPIVFIAICIQISRQFVWVSLNSSVESVDKNHRNRISLEEMAVTLQILSGRKKSRDR